jgi:hypothetical protein
MEVREIRESIFGGSHREVRETGESIFGKSNPISLISLISL